MNDAPPVRFDPLHGRRDLWRGNRVVREQPTVASGHAELDALLPGGGWPLGVLSEICCTQTGLGEISLLLPALARLQDASRWLAWVAPPYPLYAPALAQAGIDPARCLLVEPPQPGLRHGAARAQQALWASEQLLRGGACAAVLLWWDGEDTNALRRLQLAAESGQSLALLFRPAAAALRLSPAALRVRVEAGPALEILKCRGGDWRAGRGQKLRLLARQPRWNTGAGAVPAPLATAAPENDAAGAATQSPADATPPPKPTDWRAQARRERQRRS